MKPFLLIFFNLMIFVTATFCQPAEVIWLLSPYGTFHPYLYSGGDEFDGDHLDKNKWNVLTGSNKCNKELQYYVDEESNIEVSNGTLKLKATQEAVYGRPLPWHDPDYVIDCTDHTELNTPQWYSYKSAAITWKHPLKWKLIEFGCRLPSEGQGLWPAFFEHTQSPREEIDFIEAKGEKPTEIHCNVHYHVEDGNWSNDGWKDLGYDLTSQIRHYTFLWDSFLAPINNYYGDIIWNCNDNTFAVCNIEAIFNRPHITYINLAIANDDGPFNPGPNSDTEFPATYEIDYVRYYTKLEPGSIIELCNYEQQATDMRVLTGADITIGGTSDCEALIKNGEYLTSVATNSIYLKSGFHAQNGSNFKAYTVNMYDKTNTKEFQYNMGNISNLNIYDSESNTTKNKLNDQFTIKLYPNPSNGIIYFNISGDPSKINSCNILNSYGQSIYVSYEIKKDNYFDISHLRKGIYYLNLSCNGEVLSHKIILR